MYEIKNLRIINGRSYGIVTVKYNSKWGTNRESSYLFFFFLPPLDKGQHPMCPERKIMAVVKVMSNEFAPKQEVL